ncbi:DnaJ family domain-containing protein [Zhihengliuella flava]|uniref:DnaJ homologue subfamily C member 28 conserved domain-containing protein n=1 Tax=Zhihengliuella flava TaxID=1285193 RepID=A0A931DB98_9MICC|nr:DUF1992 domain-containing protein [Zhihengliuella flava]MBG6084251.1 hypothetical protein [Zhihengliuella flava]
MGARHDDERPPRQETDPVLRAARYRDQQERASDVDVPDESGVVNLGGERLAEIRPRLSAHDDVGAVAASALEQAMDRGDFDSLSYAGRPLPGSTTAASDTLDPDWWVKSLIEREGIRGLGPPAIALRTEDAHLDQRLAALGSAWQVRQLVEDFNARVVEARRQLLGGPPVVTPLRDVDAEVERWQLHRDERAERAARQRRRREVARQRARAASRARFFSRWIPWR